MLRHARVVAWRAERAAAEAGVIAALRQLRRLGLADFADVMLAMPDPEFPSLSAVLPRMPPIAEQERLSGGAGKPIMHDAVTFLRVLDAACRDLTGRRLRDLRLLDASCGWGRLLRLLLHVSDPERITGVAREGRALDLCRAHGVRARLLDRLPADGERFDLITSDAPLDPGTLAELDAAMADARAAIDDRGLLAVAARPIEFWDFLAQQGDADAAAARDRHIRDGHAIRATAAGPAELSVDLEWFSDRYPQWELRGTDRGWDELRTILLLTPR
jgi:hypothetical protein